MAQPRRTAMSKLRVKLTQEQLAEKLDTSLSYVSNVERGAAEASKEFLMRWAKKVHCSAQAMEEAYRNTRVAYARDIIRKVSKETFSLVSEPRVEYIARPAVAVAS